ncbi:MAG: tetratricopeptide repeat protein [Chitinophagales bacterium]
MHIQQVHALSNTDSILQVIGSTKDPAVLAQAYGDLAFALHRQEPDSAIRYGNKAIDIAIKNDLKQYLHPAYNAIGLAYQSKGMYALSIQMLEKQFPYIVGDTVSLARAYHNIGLSYKFLDNMQSALENEIKAASLMEGIHDPTTLGAIYYSIGNIYRNMGDYTLALKYLQNSLNTYQDAKKTGTKNLDILITNTYVSIGNLYQVQYIMDSALAYHQKAISLYQELGDKYNMAIAYETLGDDFMIKAQYPESLENYTKAKDLMAGLKSEIDVGYELYKISYLYHLQKEYSKALQLTDSALAIFTRNGADNYRMNVYDMRYMIYDASGNAAAALENYKLYQTLKDSLNNASQQEEILRLKEEFETTQKEQKIENLETENKLQLVENQRQIFFRNIAFGLIIILLAFGFVLWNRYRIKQQLKQLAIRNDIAIDLHDEVGSSLSSIKMLSELAASQKRDSTVLENLLDRIHGNATETAERMHDIIWMINPKHDHLADILQRMENFMFDICSPKEIAFSLHKQIDPDIKLSMLQRKNLLLIFKEAVNNAVKYSGAAEIKASVSYQQGNISLTVSDNGSGFDPSTIQHGNGLDNMQLRTKEVSGDISINSSSAKGTQIDVRFPV